MNAVLTTYLAASMFMFMMLMFIWSSKNLTNVVIKAVWFVMMGVAAILLASQLGLVVAS